MRNYLERVCIHLETIGPVHIGSGESLRKNEWILDSRTQTATVLDSRKFFRLLGERGLLRDYENYVMSSKLPLHRWLNEKNISRLDIQKAAKYTLDTSGLDLKNGKIRDMTLTMKDPYGLPYIPGSSLKGALRNIILAKMMREKPYNLTPIKEEVYAFRGNPKKFLNRESNRLNEDYFHTKGISERKADAVNDIMSGIRISDSNAVSLDSLTLCQKVDAGTNGKTWNIPLVRECIRPETEFEFELTIDKTQTKLTVDFIEKAICDFMEDYNELYLKYFPKETQFEGMHIYIGGGVGFPSKTVLNRLTAHKRDRVKLISTVLEKTDSSKESHSKRQDDVRNGVSPHTIKLTDISGDLLQMGVCKIDFSTV